MHISQLPFDVLFAIFSYDTIPHLASTRLTSKFFSNSISRFFSEWIQEVTLRLSHQRLYLMSRKEVKPSILRRLYSLRKVNIEYHIRNPGEENVLKQGLQFQNNIF